MKTILYTCFLICSASICFSQVDTGMRSDTVIYVTPEEEAFMIDKETKGLIKLTPTLFNLNSLFEEKEIGLGYEFKIGNSFSLYPNATLNFLDSFDDIEFYSLGLEGRYFYRHNDNIKSGKQANNLSGNYISLGTDYLNSVSDFFEYNISSYSLNLGYQQRFLNYGYIDQSLSLTYFNSSFDPFGFPGSNSETFYQISFSFNTQIGIGFGQNHSLSDNAKCPIFRCNQDRFSAWKYNVRRTWGISYRKPDNFEGAFSFFLNPNFIYEKKIGSSSVSINHDFDLFLNYSDVALDQITTEFGLQIATFSYRPALRSYIFQKNQMTNGKSGNNLSGFYAFVRPEFLYNNSKFFQLSERTVFLNISGQAGIGYQKEILNNLFIDIDLGVSKNIYNSKTSVANTSIQLVSDIKVGFMFDNFFDKFKESTKRLNIFN